MRFRRYLDQDVFWPLASGCDIRVEEMTDAHRLSVLWMLEGVYGGDATSLPLVRRLRALENARESARESARENVSAGGPTRP